MRFPQGPVALDLKWTRRFGYSPALVHTPQTKRKMNKAFYMRAHGLWRGDSDVDLIGGGRRFLSFGVSRTAGPDEIRLSLAAGRKRR
jgi:hypothetical protein